MSEGKLWRWIVAAFAVIGVLVFARELVRYHRDTEQYRQETEALRQDFNKTLIQQALRDWSFRDGEVTNTAVRGLLVEMWTRDGYYTRNFGATNIKLFRSE